MEGLIAFTTMYMDHPTGIDDADDDDGYVVDDGLVVNKEETEEDILFRKAKEDQLAKLRAIKDSVVIESGRNIIL